MANKPFANYRSSDWFDDVLRYIDENYYYQEERLMQTFRYVKLDKKNGKTFSLEYSSILRDVGAIFISTMDELYKNIDPDPNDYPNINQFRPLLLAHNNKISGQLVEVKPLKHTGRFRIWPFSAFKKSNGLPKWWNAYNKIKHGDIRNYEFGNLKNTIIALGATFLLLAGLTNRSESELFYHYGLLSEDEEKEEFKSTRLFSDP
jgi:hypothetical protein